MENVSVLSNRQIARAASTVMVAYVISNLAGLARQILVANAFGTQAEMEAFNAANRVSETLFLLVAGGALSSAFIPTFTALLTQSQRKEAWRLASAIANLILIILIMMACILAIFAPQLVRYVLAPGFVSSPQKEALTIHLLRLMLPSAVIFGLSGLVMGILNSHQIFLTPALTPSMYQLGMIFGVLFLSPKIGIYGLGWGVVIGAAFHLFLQLPALVRLHGEYFPSLGLHLKATRQVALLMGPRLVGVAVVQLNFWINTFLASKMPEGSVTAVVLGFALMLMPQAAIAQSIAVVAMPTFSAQFALGRIDEMRSSLVASLRGALLFAIPATAGLILLRTPLIQTLYQRGEFDERSTSLVAWALLWYAAGLVGHCIVEILSRAFYAMQDTRTPVYIGVVAMSLNAVLSIAFSSFFRRIGWMPHGGLALANSLATGLEASLLLLIIRRRLNGLEGRRLLSGTGLVLVPSMVMAFTIWVWTSNLANRPAWFIAAGGLFLGVISYFMIAWLIGVDEIRIGLKIVANRVQLKLSRMV